MSSAKALWEFQIDPLPTGEYPQWNPASSANIMVTNGQDVGISHCIAHRPQEGNGEGLLVTNSQDVRIIDNDFENANVNGSLHTYVANNHILGAYGQLSSWTVFRNNNMEAYSDVFDSTVFVSGEGSNNHIVANRIDGKWNGIEPHTQGSDDGILLKDEQNDTVEDDTIANTWDAGIESVGFLYNTQILNNQIANIGFPAVGAYYNTDWRNNLVRGNQATNALTLIAVMFKPDNPPASVFYFKDRWGIYFTQVTPTGCGRRLSRRRHT